MKKKLLAMVLGTFAMFSVAQAKLYIGIEGGYSAEVFYGTGLKTNSLYLKTASTDTISDAIDYGPNGFSIAGVVGTEDSYGRIFGTRWGLSAGYTELSKNSQTFKYVDAGLSYDLMLNFLNSGSFSFGIFGGVSADYHYGLTKIKGNADHSFDFNGRVGVTTLLAQHHRIEFIAKLPIASMSVANSSEAVLGGGVAAARTTFGASYKFVF